LSHTKRIISRKVQHKDLRFIKLIHSSGANDGMAFPFLFLSLFLINEHNVGTAIGKWVYITCLFQITLSCIIGIVVGYVARIILQWSERK
jgi:NhaP-type Na+/H+ or K+/H+ antiporter